MTRVRISVEPFFLFFLKGKKSAAATPTSSKMGNPIVFLRGFFVLSAIKQAIRIKLATTVGHFYVTLTLQTFTWLAHLVLFSGQQYSPHRLQLSGGLQGRQTPDHRWRQGAQSLGLQHEAGHQLPGLSTCATVLERNAGLYIGIRFSVSWSVLMTIVINENT